MIIGNVQIGKNGVTDNFILTLVNQFKKYKNIKVRVLRNARGSGKEGKMDVKRYSNELLRVFGPKYTAKIIGFTINLKKWRKSVRD